MCAALTPEGRCRMNHTTEELQSALDAIRRRPAHRHWPEQLCDVLSNPISSRLLRVEATLRRRRFKPKPYRLQQLRTAPALVTGRIDRKRAAAGDIDD